MGSLPGMAREHLNRLHMEEPHLQTEDGVEVVMVGVEVEDSGVVAVPMVILIMVAVEVEDITEAVREKDMVAEVVVAPIIQVQALLIQPECVQEMV